MNDILFIKDLTAKTTIGERKWEQQIKQTVHIDLEIMTDIKKAASSDLLTDALDYHALSVSILHYLENNKFQLIETLAEKLAEFIQQEFAVLKLRLTVSKPAALAGVKNVGVTIERSIEEN